MVRLTDVERGLVGIQWPESVEAQFVLDVDDPLHERNDGQFSVEVSGGSATIESAGVERGADVVVGVGTLSRLAIGAIGVERAERLCDLEILDDEVRSTLDVLFESDPVCLREFF